jgi:cytochrome c biogenesis protein CcmG/thiol:disulfide interchange protein DsbE
MSRRWLLWVPLTLFVAVIGIAVYALRQPQEREIRSRLKGQPLPAFDLPAIVPGKPGLASKDFASGKPRLLNIMASWCVPCIAEAPQLMALRRAGAEIDAIAIRDTPEDLQAVLTSRGDPYVRVGSDTRSAVQLALGSAGVPETFVIDGHGKIVDQHIGVIRDEDVPDLLAELEKAK